MADVADAPASMEPADPMRPAEPRLTNRDLELPPARYDAQGRRLCHATSKTTGEQCRGPAMSGSPVCRSHGGASDAARKKARLRLAALADPAIATLAKEMVKADKSSDRQRAANSILDRAGFGRVTKVEAVDAKDVLLDRLRAMREKREAEALAGTTPASTAAASADLDLEDVGVDLDVADPDRTV